ncbi:hypothetical protein HT031_002545 [Scenedesmus sp. PABB004]|nr:hypothetical protein HT031_002545 [Scenedesmus sp. PABB004]
MPTPAAGRAGGGDQQQRTPGSGRHTAVSRTPTSALTPNDDAAERASARKQRCAGGLRKSLAGAFAGGGGDGGPTLAPEALASMFEHCIKLAAENKITDRNVWQLELIQHLPSIVRSGQGARGGVPFNFQKMSGGLDAGVTIYSKRVDHTYKEAFQSLQGMGAAGRDDEEEDGDGGDGEGSDGDDVDDATAAAAKAAKAEPSRGRGARGGGAGASEEATLAAPEALRAKKGDATFGVDPLFHKMSALFDEGGAKGLLLLNRSVFDGAAIMTDPRGVPEAAFPLDPQPAPDALVGLTPLRGELAACARAGGAAGAVTPGLAQLHDLLRAALAAAPRGRDQAQVADARVDVSAVMAAATPGCPAGGRRRRRRGARGCALGGSGAVVAAFLAEAAAAGDADDAADGWGGGEPADGSGDGEGHAGYGDDDSDDGAAADARGDDGWGAPRRERGGAFGVLGLGGGAGPDGAADVLDADALQQLLGGQGGGRPGAAPGGWAGSAYWRYRSAAAAIARLGGGATKAKSAAGGAARARPSAQRIDFENLQELPAGALARGSRKQTCLVTASAGNTLLPVDLRFQAASLAQLSLKPAPRLGGDGGDGYNAGDLSHGDPGFAPDGGQADGGGGGAPSEWWSPEHELLAAPKRTAGLGVTYQRSAKQVDVRALKDLLWQSLVSADAADAARGRGGAPADAGAGGGVRFQDVVADVPAVSAAGPVADVSVHMCFICMLHLANERGLVIRAADDLRTLTISNVPAGP